MGRNESPRCWELTCYLSFISRNQRVTDPALPQAQHRSTTHRNPLGEHQSTSASLPSLPHTSFVNKSTLRGIYWALLVVWSFHLATLVENASKAELRQRSWATPDDVIPSRSQKFVKTRTGTEEQRRRPPSHQRRKWRFFYCHLPCGWLRMSIKTRFLCPGSGAVREGELPGEESLPHPLRPLEPGWGR